MGRDAFLTRLVLGRSAHDPPDSSTADTPSGELSPRHDERGHPTNPQARALGRALRDAQNHVLAAVGVVERKRVHIASAFPLPPSKDPQVLKQVEAEDLSGTLVAIVGTLTRYAGTWWVSALQDRILTYDYPDDLSFTELVSSQYRWAGPAAFFCAGLPAQLVSMLTNDGDLWASAAVSLLDGVVLFSRLSRRNRQRVLRWKPWIHKFMSIFVELAFAPIVLHAAYQRLFLTPAAQLLPPARAFYPWSSPIRAMSLPANFPLGHGFGWIDATCASPVFMMIAWRRAMIRIQRVMYEPLEKGILSPDNPDLYTADESAERNTALGRTLSLSRRSNHAWANWFFSCLDWSWCEDTAEEQTAGRLRGLFHTGAERIPSDAESRVAGHGRPGTPVGSSDRPRGARSPSDVPLASSRWPPTSPSDSHGNHNDERDATVRIASRDEGSGVVSLEIALPEELQNSGSQDVRSGGRHRRRNSGVRMRKRTHRVTHLAEEPAEMLGSWINFTFSDWVLLPLKAMGLRMIAQSYLGSASTRSHGLPLATRVYSVGLGGLGLRRVGTFAGRVGLCCALEILFGLGLWGIECAAVTVVGRRYFKWGRH